MKRSIAWVVESHRWWLEVGSCPICDSSCVVVFVSCHGSRSDKIPVGPSSGQKDSAARRMLSSANMLPPVWCKTSRYDDIYLRNTWLWLSVINYKRSFNYVQESKAITKGHCFVLIGFINGMIQSFGKEQKFLVLYYSIQGKPRRPLSLKIQNVKLVFNVCGVGGI